MNTRDLLFSLLRYAIKGETLDIGALKESLSSEKLVTLFKVSKRHDVAHLVAFALEKNGLVFDEKIWQDFIKEKEQAVLRYEMINADYKEICGCLEKENIFYVPLKGAVVRDYYPEPWMRTSCDIDILVHEEDIDRVVKALTGKHQYRVEGKKGYHDISLFSPFGMHLELHYNIKENIRQYDKLLTQVWLFSTKSKENSSKHLQTNEFLIFHILAHMAYHFVGGGCGLRSVLDLWVLEKNLDLDEKTLNRMLKDTELIKFYDVVKVLSEYWFDSLQYVTDTVLLTEKYILLGGVYGTKKQGVAIRQAMEGNKFKYFLSRLFMPYESLAIIYPIIKKYKILTPFCQMARWFGAIFKCKKVSKEIKKVTGTSEAETSEATALLTELGL